MVIVMGSFRIPAASFDRALPLMDKVVRLTREEDGCLLYSYARDTVDPELVRVAEQWRDRAALARHFETEHMADWVRERGDLGLSERNIRLFETDEGEAI